MYYMITLEDFILVVCPNSQRVILAVMFTQLGVTS